MFEEPKDLFHLYIRPPRNQRLGVREAVCFPFLWTLHLLRDFARYVRIRKAVARPDFKAKKIVYANTYNNYSALSFLVDHYKDAVLATDGGFVGKMGHAVNVRKYLQSYRRLDKYIFLLYLWIHPKYRVTHFDRIRRDYGFIDSFVNLLRGNEPVCIFISNDHFPTSRALILACRKLGILCIYIQHASVSVFFPPLRSSHALLYGKYSADIYSGIPDSEGKIIPVGNHRFDGFKEAILNKSATGKIGVAYNTRDEIGRVKELCDYIASSFGKENVVVRGHPADKREFDKSYQKSASLGESSLDFLKAIDVLVAGNSSILLEAAAMNVEPIQFYFWDVPSHFVDYYGFIKTGVAREARTKEEIVTQIGLFLKDSKSTARQRTKLFDASVGETYEFQVEKHIVSILEGILSDL